VDAVQSGLYTRSGAMDIGQIRVRAVHACMGCERTWKTVIVMLVDRFEGYQAIHGEQWDYVSCIFNVL
jgi:hypothetical protein